MHWYHWTVLPQGMINSPTICHLFVADALAPVGARYPQSITYHYVDGILVCGQDGSYLQDTIWHLNLSMGCSWPLKNSVDLSLEIFRVDINWTNCKTTAVNFKAWCQNIKWFTKVTGSKYWVRPILGLATCQLKHLFAQLKEGSDFTTNIICRSYSRIRYN